MVEAAFVTHFPIPPIYPYLPFTPGYHITMAYQVINLNHFLKFRLTGFQLTVQYTVAVLIGFVCGHLTIDTPLNGLETKLLLCIKLHTDVTSSVCMMCTLEMAVLLVHQY